MKNNFGLLEDKMGPDHRRTEQSQTWGCALLAAFVFGLLCAGGCLAAIAITMLRGSWWN